MLNEIIEVESEEEDFFWELKLLFDWLEIDCDCDRSLFDRATLSPSLITRSDAQILGLSNPRFACRLSFDQSRSVFNFRRLQLISGLASNRNRFLVRAANPDRRLDSTLASDIYGGQVDVTPWSDQSLNDLFTDSEELADAIIQLPQRFRGQYEVLECDLGICYGGLESYLGVPYVRMMNFSGVCTQSVLFLASVLLEEHASSINGVAEISARCREFDLGEFSVGEIGDNQIHRYCNEINLRANKQMIPLEGGWSAAAETFSMCLESYLKSNMPVSVPVDVGRFVGEGEVFNKIGSAVTLKNLIESVSTEIDFGEHPEFEQEIRNESLNHQVLVIGSGITDGGKFLVHDPSSFPFLPVSGDQLVQAGIYSSEDRASISPPTFFSYTPNAVKLPLANYRTQGRNGIHAIAYGAIYFSSRLRSRRGHYRALFPQPKLRPSGNGKFRLCRKENVDSVLTSTVGKKILPTLNSIKESCPNWVWVQYFDDEVWVWNAEVEYRRDLNNILEIRKSLLIAVGGHNEDGTFFEDVPLQVSKTAGAPTGDELGGIHLNDDELKIKKFIDLGVISSSSGLGLERSLTQIPEMCNSIDLYTFMFEDTAEAQGVKRNASGTMVAAVDSPELFEQQFNGIVDLIKNSPNPQIRINALASFAPEIINLGDSRYLKEDSVKILIFLRMFAERLNACEEINSDIRAIEIVGGSRVRGLFRASINHGGIEARDELIASFNEQEAQTDRFISVISDAIEATEGIDIPFAIELEPGHLNFINDETTLLDVSVRLSENPKVSNQVGFNVDIPHWRMAEIDEANLHAEIANRIVHFHISDHHKGHFRDIPYGALENNAERNRSANFIKKVVCDSESRDHSKYPKFSGAVSIELEACEGMGAEFAYQQATLDLKSVNISPYTS